MPLAEAKELGMVYINIIRGAKEPRKLQNHRRVMMLWKVTTHTIKADKGTGKAGPALGFWVLGLYWDSGKENGNYYN